MIEPTDYTDLQDWIKDLKQINDLVWSLRADKAEDETEQACALRDDLENAHCSIAQAIEYLSRIEAPEPPEPNPNTTSAREQYEAAWALKQSLR